jgi:hypothetical protein
MKDLSMHVMDILQNSTRAKATVIKIEIEEDTQKDILRIVFTDNGTGMTPQMVEQVRDPFFTTRTVRKVGLGLPLLEQNCQQTGGELQIYSELGKGTTVTALFSYSHIDRPALGDMAGVIALTASAYPDIRFIYSHTKNGKVYTFDTEEIKEALDGISIQEPEVITLLREMIQANLQDLEKDE